MAGKWIKTIDALPEWGEMVLVYYIALDTDGTPSCCGCDGRGGQIDIAFHEEIEGDSHWMGAECLPDTKVSHWMALPLTPIQQTIFER